MTKASISLQELRRKIYSKAKTEKHWRFGGYTVISAKRKFLRNPTDWLMPTREHMGLLERVLKTLRQKGLKNFLKG